MALGLLVLSQASTAAAFTEPKTYFGAPQDGGGGGRFFTGSPAEGYGCSVCHTGPKARALKLEGLPEEGYVPGATYEITVGWPGFAEFAREVEAEAGAPARASLAAECVAEPGEASGSVRLPARDDVEEEELCLVPRGAYGAEIYAVRPGEEVREQIFGCDSTVLGQRCVVVGLPCGNEKLRILWTAPAQWQETIWFSLGFVASEQAEGNAQDDGVIEVSIPIKPAPSSQDDYEASLEGGCGVTGGSDTGRALWLALPAMGLLLARRRRRRC